MIEIILMLWILPRRIVPLARERGKSGLLWTLAAIAAWLGAEILVMGIYTVVYLFGVSFFGWPEDMEKQTVTYLAYFVALVCGLVSADMVRRFLTRIPTASPFDEAPPPPPHEWRTE